MEYENLLYDFVDGSLDLHQEEQFFAMLSSNDEMRNELKQLMAMKSAIRTDYKAFTPKAESTIGIFSALGFDAPIVAPIVTGAASSVGKSLLSKPFTQMIIASLSSAAITAVIMLSLFKSGWIDSGDKNINSGNGLAKSEINSNLNQNVNLPVVSSKEEKSDLNANNISKNVTPKVIYKYIYVQRDSLKKNSNLNGSENTFANNSEPIASDVAENTTTMENINLATIDRNIQHDENTLEQIVAHNDFMHVQQFTPNSLELNNFHNGKALGFAFEIKGEQYWFSTTERVGPPSNQMFNNSSLSLLYDFTNEIAGGLEYRRETFYQNFHGMENNTLYRYEQQPNFETWSALLRITPSMIANSYLAPFGQVSFGTNQGGYVGRFMFGTEITPTQNYAFILSADYSLFRFNYQSASFYAPKLGLNIGFAAKF